MSEAVEIELLEEKCHACLSAGERAHDAVRLDIGAELAHDLAGGLAHRHPVEEADRADAPAPLPPQLRRTLTEPFMRSTRSINVWP